MKISLLLIIGLLITVLSPVALYVVAQDQIVVSDKEVLLLLTTVFLE